MNLAMTHEHVFLGGRRVEHPFGTGDVGPTDLFAYRRMWDSFIRAHAVLWDNLHRLLENPAAASGDSAPSAKDCPAGVFTMDQVQSQDRTVRAFCAALTLSRARTDPDNVSTGILAQWNFWAGKSASEIVSAAAVMLKWHQDVVAKVGGEYKDQLVAIAHCFGIDVVLPDVPSFSTQQFVIAQIEGAFTEVKGLLQIAGYGTGGALVWVGSQAKAMTEGLTDTVRTLPKVISNPLIWIAGIGIVALVGAGLVMYYVPRATPPRRRRDRRQ